MPEARVTTELLLRAALVTAGLDAVLLLLVARVTPVTFFRLKWRLAGSAAFVYALLWGLLASVLYWEDVYRHVFPPALRPWLPLVYGAGFGLVALLFWTLASRAGRRPAVWFCLLGGLVSIPGHAWGMSRGLMRVPLLAQASPWAALLFGFFEFVVYFAVIVGLARLSLALPGRRDVDSGA
jgi:hypothetical protein